MAGKEVYCYACLYNDGKQVPATYLVIALGTDERWGMCLGHYAAGVLTKKA